MLLTEICKVVAAGAGRFLLAPCRRTAGLRTCTFKKVQSSPCPWWFGTKNDDDDNRKEAEISPGGAAILFKGFLGTDGPKRDPEESSPPSTWPPAPLTFVLFNSCFLRNYSDFFVLLSPSPLLKGELASEKTAKKNSDQPQRKHFIF